MMVDGKLPSNRRVIGIMFVQYTRHFWTSLFDKERENGLQYINYVSSDQNLSSQREKENAKVSDVDIN